MFAEHRVIKYDLLQQLNQLIGQVCSHEGLDCDGHLLRVLGLGQSRLHHLRGHGGQNVDKRSDLWSLQQQSWRHPNLVDELSFVRIAFF